jgi:NhaP-type Na+/H+ or K+/H+ antiporter
MGGGALAQWLAARARIPAIVLLLALGLILGPATGLLRPSAEFGSALRPLIGLAVAIIVFEGGLALDFRDLRAGGGGIARLVLVAAPASFALSSVAAVAIGGFTWPIAIVYGAIAVVTGPTVILPMLRVARLERRSASLLKWEAIVNDPLGAILTGLVLAVLLSRSAGAPFLFGQAVLGAGLGLLLGLAAAFAFAVGARRDLIPEALKTPLLVAGALCVYVLGNAALDEAGLISATVFGVGVANQHVPGLNELRRFKEAIVVLLVSGLFIVLAADLDPRLLATLSWRALALTAAMLFLVRPVSIALATAFSQTPLRERLLLAWIAPRGIVAAATAGLAGGQLAQAGYLDARAVQPTIFLLIAASVVLQGLTLKPFAGALALQASSRPTLAILGASPWSTSLAALLTKAGVAVLLIDTYPGALRVARKLGVPVLQTEVLSRQAEEDLADNPIDYVIAATPDAIYNALVCARLAPDVGRERVFQVAPPHDHMLDPEGGMARDWRGKVLADADLDFDVFSRRYEEGWRFAIVEPPPPESLDGVLLMSLLKGGAPQIHSADHAFDESAAAGSRLVVFAPVERRLP